MRVGGERLSTVSPQNSQCPVVLSLPALTGSQLPNAARGEATAAMPGSGAQRPRPSDVEIRQRESSDLSCHVPKRVAAGIAVGIRIRRRTDPHAVEDDDGRPPGHR